MGRFFGAIHNWVKLQSEYQCMYGVVDYHAMTMPFNPKKLRQQSWDLAFSLLATGLKEENIFIQSLIPEHVELGWIFNCMSSYGEMGRMTQFKDKSKQVQEASKDSFISTGLFTYPVLQAADILIYKADFVPVGKDQEQHLELTRNIAQRFNHVVGQEYFVLPESLFTEIPKVMSTADPNIKMSASKGDKHNISIFAAPERIKKQIKSAVTDDGSDRSQMGPGIENIMALIKATDKVDLVNELSEGYYNGSLQYGALKEKAAEVLIAFFTPIRERRAEILADKKRYKQLIKESSGEIRKRAQQTLREVKELVGLLNVKT